MVVDKLKNIGAEMKKYRVVREMKQITFGRELGVSGKAISSYETGRASPTLKTIIKFLENNNG